jgi:uncharacterized protein YqeY
MSLKENIMAALKEAMKAKNSDKTMVLRSLKAKILEKEISERKAGESLLSDEQIIDVLLKPLNNEKNRSINLPRATVTILLRRRKWNFQSSKTTCRK